MSISDDRIAKAGAYVLYQGRYAFMVGFGGDTGTSALNVVRFGGHREPGESPVQCALRELKEESSLDLVLCDAPCTYLARSGESVLERACFSGRPRPILAREGADRSVSVMYLAYGSGVLAPAMETQGVLLLTREDLRALCSGTLTLGSCLERGAIALLATPLPNSPLFGPPFKRSS